MDEFSEEYLRSQEKLREQQRAHFTTQKTMINLLRSAAKATHRSLYPEVWSRTLAPVFNMKQETLHAALLQLGSSLDQLKQLERGVSEITHGVLDNIVYYNHKE